MLCIKRKLPKYLAFVVARLAELEYTICAEAIEGPINWTKACFYDNPNLVTKNSSVGVAIKFGAKRILNEINIDPNEGLLYSCEAGSSGMIHYFINRGAQCWDLALERVVVYKHYNFINLFLRKGAAITPQTEVTARNSPTPMRMLGIKKKCLIY